MAEEVFVTVRGGRLVGATASDAEKISALEGETFRAVLTTPRNRSRSQLSLFWVMCEMIAENLPSPVPITKEGIAYVLKVETGHADPVRFLDGTYRFIPRSIAFNKMRPAEFSEWLDRAFAVASRDFGPALAAAVAEELERLMTEPEAPAERRRRQLGRAA